MQLATAAFLAYGSKPTYECGSTDSNMPMSLGIPIAMSRPLAVVMVGLPARGKTYIARKLAR